MKDSCGVAEGSHVYKNVSSRFIQLGTSGSGNARATHPPAWTSGSRGLLSLCGSHNSVWIRDIFGLVRWLINRHFEGATVSFSVFSVANAKHLSYMKPLLVSRARSTSTNPHDLTGWRYIDLMRIGPSVLVPSGASNLESYWSAMLPVDKPSLRRFLNSLRVVEIFPVWMAMSETRPSKSTKAPAL